MAKQTHQELLNILLSATRPSEVLAALRSIGDRDGLSVDEPFGDGYQWHFFGDTDSNVSSVNLASKAGRSLTERVTNAIDAVLEKSAAQATGPEPSSPMEAAQRWFGRPPSTATNGLFKQLKEFSANGYDRLVRVVMTVGDKEVAPTIDIVDDGIGIAPADFGKTILSLQKGNKIKKRYLAGVFGQGGASTLSFCDYVLIVSRHLKSPNLVGFTLVKLLRLTELTQLSDSYKEDAYVYLATVDQEGKITVPSVEMSEKVDAYPGASRKPESIGTGTLVRHYGYRLEGLEKTLGPSPGNLYHLLHTMMFDPLLPFRVIDIRKEGSFKDELITGSRNRLMRYTESDAKAAGDASDPDERGTEMRHFSPREMVSPRSEAPPNIGVEYWVPLNRRKSGDKITLRHSSSELFIDKNHPVLGTVNGQNQGELTARILKALELTMVANHIVIHIDSSSVSPNIRNSLFSSTREGFKEGEVLNELTRVISNRLKEDDTLFDIERELLETMIKKQTSETDSEVKKEITKLLRDAGFAPTTQGEVVVAAEDGDLVVEAPSRRGKRPMIPQKPLATLAYPDVTRFEIVFPDGPFSVHKQDNCLIKLETDADFKYDRENRIAVRSEPAKLELASKGMLNGGRMNWRLRPTQDAVAGDKGEVIATLTKPDGSQLVAKVDFEVLAAREERAKKEKGQIPDFDVIPVNPYSDPDDFETIWGKINKPESVAYKAIKSGGSLKVYYNTAFGPFDEQTQKLKTQPAMLSLFTSNYEIWIGYHAIIQDQHRPAVRTLFDLEDEQLDPVMESERAVVAEMQAKQALKVAELQSQALKQKSSA